MELENETFRNEQIHMENIKLENKCLIDKIEEITNLNYDLKNKNKIINAKYLKALEIETRYKD